MNLKKVVPVMLFGLAVAGSTFASDPQPAPNTPSNFTADSRMILSAAGREQAAKDTETQTCLMMRTYRVRRNMDRDVVIPTGPAQAAFNPNDIVGYSICQKANRFEVKSTQ